LRPAGDLVLAGATVLDARLVGVVVNHGGSPATTPWIGITSVGAICWARPKPSGSSSRFDETLT
jgi:hypothetical protein